MSHIFSQPALLGKLGVDKSAAALAGATAFSVTAIGDGLEYRFDAGLLTRFAWLTTDMLLHGRELCVFILALWEAGTKNCAEMRFGLLTECQARVRIPLSFVNQNRWMFDREGAYLKPCAGGQRVELDKVDRMTLTVCRIGTTVPVRWCMTPLTASVAEPARLTEPRLPRGVLMDELGQSTLHEWPGKSRNAAAVTERLRKQLADAPSQRWPECFARRGGWKAGPRLEATGFFRTHHDGRRWWLADPEGYLFWSTGMDCVGLRAEANVAGLHKALAWLPPMEGEFSAAYNTHRELNGHHVSYLTANLIRAFGADDWHRHWATIAIAQLRDFGFNTIANWSDWKIAQAAGFPYVRPLREHFADTPMVFRDFPDVWNESFSRDCAAYAAQLRETLGDSALIGYFLMNEPTWGFARETPALGMLYNNPASATRTALREYLRLKYGSADRLARAWDVPVSFDQIEKGLWNKPVNAAAEADLAAFSTLMVDRLFRGMTEACRKIDPHHMNLGARYYAVPPDWCLAGMTCFDVFSLNAYARKIPADKYDMVAARLNRPVLAGEWHFGALDAGLPASGIGHVRNQADRGKAYGLYLEDAAACPSCVGVHYFQMYDQSALGRYDGENYNIGFVDTCNRPYEELAHAARLAHERMYDVAAGKLAPFNEAPEYLPLLFL